jgi:SAM-dependent methyltransferase
MQIVSSTSESGYTQRLLNLQSAWWRRVLDPQIPYRWFLQRLQPGFMLEVGCGVGRNLFNNGGRGVGIDHNPTSVEVARSRGFQAFTPTEFVASDFVNIARFDSLLLSHVLEHLSYEDAKRLVAGHLRYVRPGGKVILICPQPAGFRSDQTHVEYFDLRLMRRLVHELGLDVLSENSFPFPPLVGKFFTYNEWVLTASIA